MWRGWENSESPWFTQTRQPCTTFAYIGDVGRLSGVPEDDTTMTPGYQHPRACCASLSHAVTPGNIAVLVSPEGYRRYGGKAGASMICVRVRDKTWNGDGLIWLCYISWYNPAGIGHVALWPLLEPIYRNPIIFFKWLPQLTWRSGPVNEITDLSYGSDY